MTTMDVDHRYSWLVCYYDTEDRLLLAYEIDNRTEAEAESEVEKDLANTTDVDDWTLSALTRQEGS